MPKLKKISKDFGKPIGRPDTAHLCCETCGKVEGQFVTASNRLTSGTGSDADKARERGWSYVDGEWLCPECS